MIYREIEKDRIGNHPGYVKLLDMNEKATLETNWQIRNLIKEGLNNCEFVTHHTTIGIFYSTELLQTEKFLSGEEINCRKLLSGRKEDFSSQDCYNVLQSKQKSFYSLKDLISYLNIYSSKSSQIYIVLGDEGEIYSHDGKNYKDGDQLTIRIFEFEDIQELGVKVKKYLENKETENV
jgi:hypothetical protein